MLGPRTPGSGGPGYFLLELALWNTGWRQLAFGIVTLASILWITARGNRNRNELGLGRAGVRRSFALVPAAAALAYSRYIVRLMAGTLHLARGLPLWHAGLYATWAMLQEFLLQSFIFVRLERLIGGRLAILASAGVFATAHLPNPVLMAATFVMGLALSYWFWRHRNLYALGIAHALLGLCLAICLPEASPLMACMLELRTSLSRNTLLRS